MDKPPPKSNLRHHHSDWWTLFSLLILPFLAFGLIYLSTIMERDYVPRRLPPRAQRMSPQQTLVLNRAPMTGGASGLGSISEKQLDSLVQRMEAISTPSLTNTAPVHPLTFQEPTTEEVSQEPVIQAQLQSPGLQSQALVSGLHAPDGLAIDPRNGNLYISEEQDNRIVMVTPKGKRRVVLEGDELLVDDSGPRRVRHSPLQSPEGLAMDNGGGLYVVEDVPGGRVLRLQCEENGRLRNTEIIKLPGQWAPFAWEAIAISPRGELLLGGSSAEGQMKEGATLFQGALLFRDTDGVWWALSLRPASGVSAVAFSPNGEFAIYTDEIAGSIAWMDLTSRTVKEGASSYTAHSPEGLTVLPDGRLIVAEERGKLVLVDPRAASTRYLMEGLGSIESVLWDGEHNRLLVSVDDQGLVLSLPADTPWPAQGNAMSAAPVQVDGAVRHIPATVPDFLIPMLDMGLIGITNMTPQEAFVEITRHQAIMAADARTTLVYGTDEVSDPVEQVVFVAVSPNAIMSDSLNDEFSVSAIILRTRSGHIFRSKLTRMAVLAGNMMAGKFDNLGTFDLPIPFAYQAQVSARGHAVIHFAGLGQSPDISIAINPANPRESFMVLNHMTGVIEQYRLERADDGSMNNWVVSLPPRRAETWTSLQNLPSSETKPAGG